jgi:hypothetical protein
MNQPDDEGLDKDECIVRCHLSLFLHPSQSLGQVSRYDSALPRLIESSNPPSL